MCGGGSRFSTRSIFCSRVTVITKCPMELAAFPLDTQTCILRLECYGYTAEELRLFWKDGIDSGKPLTNIYLSILHSNNLSYVHMQKIVHICTIFWYKKDIISKTCFFCKSDFCRIYFVYSKIFTQPLGSAEHHIGRKWYVQTNKMQKNLKFN